MNIEIERKFLVQGDGWKTPNPQYIAQGYLNRQKERTVRIRIIGDQAFITIKSLTHGASRNEFEYPIPMEDGKALLALCEGPVLEKYRHTSNHAGMSWEVDEFLGQNEGLVVAEIELKSEDQSFDKPPWLGEEVTQDTKYFNSKLSMRPYREWYR